MKYVLESFIDFCDNMQIAEEGLFDRFKKKTSGSSNNSSTTFNTINDVIEDGSHHKYYNVKKDNVSVSFHDDVLNKVAHKDIIALYNKILSKKSAIIKVIADGAKKELKDDIDTERYNEIIKNSYVDYIDFYLSDNGKLDASVYAYDANQMYLKDINTKGISVNNVEYND